MSALLSMTGCVSYNVVGPVGAPAHGASVTSPRSAQLADVQVSAVGIDAATRQAISRSLTHQLSHYVSQAGYFERVTEYPTRLGTQDVLLKFEMTSLKGHRGPHPAYVPGALLTLTLWIWCNGPIYVDRFDVAGNLVIVDRDGVELARAKDQLSLAHNVGLYGGEYWAPTMGGKQLTLLVGKLLDQATVQLAKR
ncbi:hypothetical protein [Pseudomonas muyukensis]|uniref:Lipoprotein n=1 Tax=Pseudomonas muyukensis TaxID=2842357 RepID=A0ABX8MJ18_9PSED|nr:hypothetical protein KSS95_17710 [Pseudomonas muyukensis]